MSLFLISIGYTECWWALNSCPAVNKQPWSCSICPLLCYKYPPRQISGCQCDVPECRIGESTNNSCRSGWAALELYCLCVKWGINCWIHQPLWTNDFSKASDNFPSLCIPLWGWRCLQNKCFKDLLKKMLENWIHEEGLREILLEIPRHSKISGVYWISRICDHKFLHSTTKWSSLPEDTWFSSSSWKASQMCV